MKSLFSFFFTGLKLLTFFFIFLFLSYLIYGLYLSQFELRVFNERIELKHPPKYYDYSGVSNVHTNLSSGVGSFKDVIQKAQESGLDFIFLTDLNASNTMGEIEEYYDKLLVFIDGEYSYLDASLLTYDAKWPQRLMSLGRTQALFTDYLSRKFRDESLGIFVLAHPFKGGNQWTGEYPEGLDGIEIINLTALWKHIWQKRRGSFLKAFFLYPFNFKLALIHLLKLPQKELNLWDQLNQKQKIIGFSGADAKGRTKLFYFTINIPSYEKVFKMVRNHVLIETELTGEAKKDRKKISNSIRKGQFFISFDFLENAKGFMTYLKKKEKIYPMGSELVYEDGFYILAELPKTPIIPLKMVIYKDGNPFFTSKNRKLKKEIKKPGVYRIVVFIQPRLPFWRSTKWVPWIFTNPFYIRSESFLFSKDYLSI